MVLLLSIIARHFSLESPKHSIWWQAMSLLGCFTPLHFQLHTEKFVVYPSLDCSNSLADPYGVLVPWFSVYYRPTRSCLFNRPPRCCVSTLDVRIPRKQLIVSILRCCFVISGNDDAANTSAESSALNIRCDAGFSVSGITRVSADALSALYSHRLPYVTQEPFTSRSNTVQ